MFKSLNFTLREMGNHWRVFSIWFGTITWWFWRVIVECGTILCFQRRYCIYHLLPCSLPIPYLIVFLAIKGMSGCKAYHNYDAQRNHFCSKRHWYTSVSILMASYRSNLLSLCFSAVVFLHLLVSCCALKLFHFISILLMMLYNSSWNAIPFPLCQFKSHPSFRAQL